MWPKRINIWRLTSLAGGLFYPLLVYVSLPYAPPFALILVGLGLIALRLWGVRRDSATVGIWGVALVLAAVGLALLSMVAPAFAVKAYPSLISAAVAGVFAASLIWPPSAIERIARIREPDLSSAGQLYTRRVTQVWTAFLLANTAISAATAIWGTVEQWTLWNGLISYFLMGALFAGEFALRRFVRRGT
jgi:uncharacterized membrane protein